MPDTPPLSRPSVIYAAVLSAAALVVLAVTFGLAPPAMPERVWLAGVVIGALIVAARYPFPLPSRQQYAYLMMDTVVILGAALLFAPQVAMLLVAFGALLGELSKRLQLALAIFNASQMMFQAAVGSLVVSAAGLDRQHLSITDARCVVTVLVAGSLMHIVNTLAVAVMVAIEEHQSLPRAWWGLIRQFDLLQWLAHVGQWALAALAVVLVQAEPLALCLLALPTVTSFLSIKRHNVILRQVEDALKGTQANLAEAQRVAHLGSWEWQAASGDWLWSDELYRIFGLPPQALPASEARYLDAAHPDDRPQLAAALLRVQHQGGAESLDYRIVRPDGVERIVHVRIEAAGARDGAPTSLLGTVLDVTERKQLETRLSHQANHDALTGLPNRAHFVETLTRALANAADHPSRVAVLFVDMDNFKAINDRFGHDVGDRLLVTVADRLRGCLRERDTACRFGGDEFTILIENLSDMHDASDVATRLLHVLAMPLIEGEHGVVITPSIGLALGAPELTNPEHLLRAADVAMYRAKRGGKARYVVYDPSQDFTGRSRWSAPAA